MFLAMNGVEKIAEGKNKDQVVMQAENYAKKGGDVIVWHKDGKKWYVVAEIMEDSELTMYVKEY